MREKTILVIFGSNFFLYLTSLEGFLRVGTQFLAFCAAGTSFCLLVYKERHTIKEILKGSAGSAPSKQDSGQKANQGENEAPPTL